VRRLLAEGCFGLLAALLDRPQPIGFGLVGSSPVGGGTSFAPSARKWSRPRPIALPFIVCMSKAWSGIVGTKSSNSDRSPIAAATARAAWKPIDGIYLSNRGLVLPSIPIEDGNLWVMAAAAVGLIALYALRRRLVARQMADGKPRPLWPYALVLVVGLPALVSWGLGVSWTITMPELRGFNFVGGLTLSPEYFALLVALVTYTSAFIDPRNLDLAGSSRRAAQIRAADEFAVGLMPVIQAVRAAGALTLASIATALNDRCVRSSRGGKWHTSSVANALSRASLQGDS